MCFANTVLQVLVYSQAFHQLFIELGKYLPGKKEGKSVTPLVDATITFMKEFHTDPSRASSNEREQEDDSESWREAFVPTYIYEALKEKKRFDSMRGGQQEDAEEFLGFYLDTLEEELLSLMNASFTPAPAPQREEEQGADGWLEVGRKNKPVVTRMVSLFL